MQDLLLLTDHKLSVVIVHQSKAHNTHMWFTITVLKGAQTAEVPQPSPTAIMGSCPHVRVSGTSRTPDKNKSYWQRIAKACNFNYIVEAHQTHVGWCQSRKAS